MSRTSEKENSSSDHHQHRSRHHSHKHTHKHHPPADEYLSPEEQLRRVRKELDREKKKRRKAESRALKTSSAANTSSAEGLDSSVPDGSIARPKCPSKEKMCVIREHLGFDKLKWNAFRLCIQQALTAARLDWKKDWRSQDSDRLRRAYDAVKEEYPEARRFRGSWGIDRVAKRYWDGRKSYMRDLKNPDSYRAKRAATRQASRRSSSPEASTSTAAPRGPRARPSRVVSDSDEEEDDGDGQNEVQAAGSGGGDDGN
ncbi:hypothetical protein GGX14DRAFT_565841 [Mycena pura]|uniref:Uncharacterized protein n=1 Tax=Mycena pura TaxID=153505 RepID=A0AAD6VE46_9AGAR|nr:hypothetical protein GGX14DRAFT_565841 [Mycena pura]